MYYSLKQMGLVQLNGIRLTGRIKMRLETPSIQLQMEAILSADRLFQQIQALILPI